MLVTAKDYDDFYLTRTGRLVRNVLRHHIRKTWPNVKGSRVLGYGFSSPYLDLFLPEAELCVNAGRVEMGVLPWPNKDKSSSLLAASAELPFEMSYFDNVLLMHAMEHAGSVRGLLQESWRVLRSNGRLILIVPNRTGLWSMASWSPFGVGTPYSRMQIQDFLIQEQFDIESVTPALFALPSTKQFTHRMAPSLEKIGPYTMPALSGVYIIECTKKLYARATPSSGSKAPVRNGGRWVYVPKPAANIRGKL
tara:strand:+ start:518225 stop:518977 length:753 start_codon:yes stop_codon:yes gene_type:complete